MTRSNRHDLAELSHFAGMRSDLVQAGGGNTSVKIDAQRMLVKASGLNLSEVSASTGFVDIDYHLIRQELKTGIAPDSPRDERDRWSQALVEQSILGGSGRPSIETFLHALLPRYTLHTHPVAVNIFTSHRDWKTTARALFPEALCLDYATPGIELALVLQQAMVAQSARKEYLVFMANHGLISSASSVARTRQLTTTTCLTLERHLNLSLQRYHHVTALDEMLRQDFGFEGYVVCSDDQVIQTGLRAESEHTVIWPTCPDTLIYCGVHPVRLLSLLDLGPIRDYLGRYDELPKVLLYDNHCYFVATNRAQARQTEELLRFHLEVMTHASTDISRLTETEIGYLLHWDAEKYRRSH